LAAIVFTDIVGFSKLTEGDEVMGLELLATLKRMRTTPRSTFGCR
jgi:class 3 adenylate cyclase